MTSKILTSTYLDILRNLEVKYPSQEEGIVITGFKTFESFENSVYKECQSLINELDASLIIDKKPRY